MKLKLTWIFIFILLFPAITHAGHNPEHLIRQTQRLLDRIFDEYDSPGVEFRFVWDGWTGHLYLPKPEIDGIFIDGVGYFTNDDDPGGTPPSKVSFYFDVASNSGPGKCRNMKWGKDPGTAHQLIFNIKDKERSYITKQCFVAFVFTQTADAFAGVTWWKKIPFGFYATRVGPWDGTLHGVRH